MHGHISPCSSSPLPPSGRSLSPLPPSGRSVDKTKMMILWGSSTMEISAGEEASQEDNNTKRVCISRKLAWQVDKWACGTLWCLHGATASGSSGGRWTQRSAHSSMVCGQDIYMGTPSDNDLLIMHCPTHAPDSKAPHTPLAGAPGVMDPPGAGLQWCGYPGHGSGRRTARHRQARHRHARGQTTLGAMDPLGAGLGWGQHPGRGS